MLISQVKRVEHGKIRGKWWKMVGTWWNMREHDWNHWRIDMDLFNKPKGFERETSWCNSWSSAVMGMGFFGLTPMDWTLEFNGIAISTGDIGIYIYNYNYIYIYITTNMVSFYSIYIYIYTRIISNMMIGWWFGTWLLVFFHILE